MHSRLLSCLSLLLLSQALLCQWSIGGTPKSFDLPQFKSLAIQKTTTPSPDMELLVVQDEIDRKNNLAPRFGVPYKASIDMREQGTWTEIEDGSIWRFAINSPGAQTINLNYSDFFMPHGATLHIYAEDKSQIIGAFTEVNNKRSGSFATGFVKGDNIVLEYFEPAALRGEGRLIVKEIIHGYRSISYGADLLKGYEDSGSCMINVNCNEGVDWQVVKKSVAMILTAGNFRFCTGSLINNTLGNCQAYFITAEHCMDSQTDEQISNSIFVFNYETPACVNPNEEPDFTQNVQGCTILSTGAVSDFTLWELEEHPALAPNIPGGVFFNGWDRNNSPSSMTAAIHHPQGDVKKISIDDQPQTSSSWPGNGETDTHWAVRWNDGVTQGGSSGGPLFNQAGQMIGQLTGGSSSCTSPAAADLYGKMSWNWDSDGTEGNFGLRDFLDVNDETAFKIDGRMCGEFDLDASLQLLNPSGVICDEVTPMVRVSNDGSVPINLAGIQLKVDGEVVQNKVITNELNSFSTIDITFDSFPAPAGTDHVMLACFINVNGVSSDDNATNNCSSILFGCDSGGTIGIEELQQISLYPNPTQGSLYISGIEQATTLSLFTLNGKTIWSGNANTNQQIDLSGFPNGLYLLRMQQGADTVLKKIGLVD